MRVFNTVEEIFGGGEMLAIRSWLRESLERWFLGSDAISFRPFMHLFRANMEAHELVAAVYREIEPLVDLKGNRTATGLFREALADLLAEPIIFEETPFVYETLLKAGSLIRANEVAEALAQLMMRRRLSADVAFTDRLGRSTTFNFFRTAIYEMSRGGYESQASTHFFSLALQQISIDIDLFPVVFRQVVQRLPEEKFETAIAAAEEMTTYLFGRLDFEDYEFAREELKGIFRAGGGKKFSALSPSEQRQFALSEAVFLIEDQGAIDPSNRQGGDLISLEAISADDEGKSKSQTVNDVTIGQANNQQWSEARIDDVARELRGKSG